MWVERTIRFLKDTQKVIREIGTTIKLALGTAAGIYGAIEIFRKVILK